MKRAIFHLAFPVASLQASLRFYQTLLGAVPGRRQANWVDVILFGHQLTLHERPEQVWPAAQQGVRHFGAILDWLDWERLREHLVALQPELAAQISLRQVGTAAEHVKLLLQDPDGYRIELKAYRDLRSIGDALVAADTAAEGVKADD